VGATEPAPKRAVKKTTATITAKSTTAKLPDPAPSPENEGRLAGTPKPQRFGNISTDEALRDLCTGYCLWIGAGVGVNLGLAAGSAVPAWGAVVLRLESAAGLTPPAGLKPVDRIERCLRALRRLDFQRHLRAGIVRPLAEAIVKLADAHVAETPCMPAVIRRLAHLGAIANPIVNFNVETVTSRLVADPSGISNVRCFAPPLPGATTLLRAPRPYGMRARRNVYHPHGGT
jgi:hypothetical protein